MNGIVNLYKPSGISSAAAVAKVRRILGEKRVGHMGTLDPMAEGVLLIGIGKATRLFDFYLKKDKQYSAEFTFGYVTDTLDADGVITATTDFIPSVDTVAAACEKFVGRISQLPPLYSAKSVNGERAYKAARQGKTPELRAVDVDIYSFTLTGGEKGRYFFDIRCGAGTYIRSLCRDLAAATESLATMTMLKRTECGKFTLGEAVAIEELELLKWNAVIPVGAALKEVDRYDLREESYDNLRNGVKIAVSDAPSGTFLLYCRNELFGLAATDENGTIKITSYLKD